MSTSPRTERMYVMEEPPQVVEMRENIAALYTKGVERLAEMQKHGIDLALQQNLETFGFWKQVTAALPWAPRLSAFEQASAALERLAETQKSAIDSMVDQTRATVDMAKERTAYWKKSSESAFTFAHESFDRGIKVQRKAAEAVVSHSKSSFEKAREEFEFPGSKAVADAIQRGVDTVVEAQKAVLETVAS